MVTLDNSTLQMHLNQLQRQCSKSTKNKASIKSLMEETATCRRKWIVQERPTISAVIEKYPPLKDFDMVTMQYLIMFACISYCMYK